jgi:hypothetical protein
MDNYTIRQIPAFQTYDWLLYKHYAHRIPQIQYAFGLYNNSLLLQGIITFGYPPNYEFNNGKCIFNTVEMLTLELNRLVVNEGLVKNTLSWFVSKALSLLPKPCCVISYSDPNVGHHGYIYQATNWLYTGESTPKYTYEFENGETFDIRRGIDRKGKQISKTKILSTHRYIMLLGSKSEVTKMKKDLKYIILPYPKGDNKRYDASYQPPIQTVLI